MDVPIFFIQIVELLEDDGHLEEAKLTPLVSTLAYNASVSLAMNFKMLARLTLC